MIFRHIRTRLIAVVCTIAFVALLGIVIVDRSEKQSLATAVRNESVAESAWFERIIKLNGSSLATFAWDYTVWDDMVAFVSSVDSTWGAENIDVSLKTYGADAAYVLAPDGTVRYSATSEWCKDLKQNQVVSAVLASSMLTSPFQHFFARTNCGVIELRTAPVQPTSDDARVTPPLGYFVVGRLWTPQFLDGLKALTGINIRMISTDSLVASDTLTTASGMSDMLRYNWILKGGDGRPLSVLVCAGNADFVSVIAAGTRNIVIMVTSLIAVLVLMLWLVMTRWVTRPLRNVSIGLTQRDSQAIENLVATGTEFANIGVLIERFGQAEDALRESQRSLQTLFANLPGMAYRCANDPTWTMEMVSDGCADLTGYAPEEMVNNRLLSYGDLVHPEDRQMVWNDVQEAVKQKRPFYLRYRIRDRHGKIRWVEEHGRGVFDNDGRFKALEGFIADITERIKADTDQAALREQLDVARRMESLGLLAGGVAHDLNNMLGPLVAYPEMILESLPPDSDVRDQVELLGESAQKAAAVIQDLLTLARRGRYEMCPTNLNEVINDYLRSPSFQQLRTKKPHIIVNAYLDEEIPPVHGSATHLFKVLMNLVVNAYDAMAEGGDLTIRTSAPFLQDSPPGAEPVPPGQYVAVRISDTGSGIAEADLKRIFEPYFSTKKMGGSGTGLGLAIVYGTIKDHHGTMEVLSKVGQGTSFVLYFPASLDSAMPVPEAEVHSYTGKGMILVIDDVAEQRTVTSRLLQSLGFTATAVSTGRQAIAEASARRYDLAIIDMRLEGDLDGYDTLVELRAVQPELAAVIISGYASNDRVQLALDHGAHTFVAKPFTRESLGKAVYETLATHRAPVSV